MSEKFIYKTLWYARNYKYLCNFKFKCTHLHFIDGSRYPNLQSDVPKTLSETQYSNDHKYN